MEYITVSARTLDDAITEALVQLGVTSDQLDYQVIEKGSAGFLGIGMKQAVIKARRKEEAKEEEPEIEIPKVDVSLVKEPVKKEVKATVSGIYITSVKGVRGPLPTSSIPQIDPHAAYSFS